MLLKKNLLYLTTAVKLQEQSVDMQNLNNKKKISILLYFKN